MPVELTFIGGASTVAQVDKFTPANVEIGDTFSITLEDEAGATQTESFVATVASVANVTAGLAAAGAASTKSLFTALTWSDFGPGTETRATAKVAGVPFYVNATAAVNGGAANTQTLTRAAVTANQGPLDWNTAINWSTATVPAAGDTPWVDGRAVNAILYGMKQTAIAVATVNVGLGMRYPVGSPTAPLRIGYTNARIGYAPDDGSSPQGSNVYLDSGTAANALTEIFDTAAQGASGLAPVIVKSTHAGAKVVVYGGVAGVATGKAGDTSTVGTIDVVGGRLSVAAGVTWTTITQSGGKLFTYGAGTTLTNNGGEVTTEGTGLIGTLLVGGTANVNHRTVAGDSVTTLQLRGGTADFSGDSRTITVNALSYRRGRIHAFKPTQVTFTGVTIDWDVNTDLTLQAA